MIDKAIKATTQEHLDIYTVTDHLVVLKDGSVALVIQTTAINFNLLSEEEQDATIYAYASLLNSLSFSIQVLIRSSKKDISDYIDLLDEKLEETQNQKVKEQLIKYRGFVKNLVKDNNVLEKRFYIVVPFTALEMGLKASQLNPFAKEPQKPPYELDYILNKAKLTLYPRRDHLIRQLGRIGLRAKQVETRDLVNLYYRIYNRDNKDEIVNLPINENTPVPEVGVDASTTIPVTTPPQDQPTVAQPTTTTS